MNDEKSKSLEKCNLETELSTKTLNTKKSKLNIIGKVYIVAMLTDSLKFVLRILRTMPPLKELL